MIFSKILRRYIIQLKLKFFIQIVSIAATINMVSCKPKSGPAADQVVSEAIEKQEKYTYSQTITQINNPESALVFFGVIPDTPPQPGTYRHLKYILIEGEERSVFVDTQRESFSDWSEFSHIHVVLPPELLSEGKKISTSQGLNLTAEEDNPIPVIIAGVSIVAGIGVAGVLFSRYKSKAIDSVGQSPTKSVKVPSSPIKKTELPDANVPKSISPKPVAPKPTVQAERSLSKDTRLTPKTPEASGGSFTSWVSNNKGSCALGLAVVIAIATGCHYFSDFNSFFSSSAYAVNSNLKPVAEAVEAVTETKAASTAVSYFGSLGFWVPRVSVDLQLDWLTRVFNTQTVTDAASFATLITLAKDYYPSWLKASSRSANTIPTASSNNALVKYRFPLDEEVSNQIIKGEIRRYVRHAAPDPKDFDYTYIGWGQKTRRDLVFYDRGVEYYENLLKNSPDNIKYQEAINDLTQGKFQILNQHRDALRDFYPEEIKYVQGELDKLKPADRGLVTQQQIEQIKLLETYLTQLRKEESSLQSLLDQAQEWAKQNRSLLQIEAQ